MSNKVRHFKTHDELEARRRQFISEADKSLVQIDNFPVINLKKLSNDELLDGIEHLLNHIVHTEVIIWRYWWELRTRFKSDTYFGKFIAELRENPARAICVSGKEDISRMHNAGRFCEKYKITSLEAIGLQKTAIYELSRPSIKDIAGDVLQSLKQDVAKKIVAIPIPNSYVIDKIQKFKPVATIEKEPAKQLELIDYTQEPVEPRIIEVIGNVAQIPEVLEQISHDSDNTIEVIPEAAAALAVVEPAQVWIQEAAFEDEEDAEYIHEAVMPKTALSGFTVNELLEEVSNRDGSKLTDDEKLEELILVASRWKSSFLKNIPIGQAFVRYYQNTGYFKK